MLAGKAANKASGKTAAVAAGTAGAVGSAALDIVGAPLMSAGLAHEFVHGIDVLSNQCYTVWMMHHAIFQRRHVLKVSPSLIQGH